jgi:hypothetical protein
MVNDVAKTLFARTLLVFALTLGSAAALADTLLIDGIAVDQQSATSRPKSGMSMANVSHLRHAHAETRCGRRTADHALGHPAFRLLRARNRHSFRRSEKLVPRSRGSRHRGGASLLATDDPRAPACYFPLATVRGISMSIFTAGSARVAALVATVSLTALTAGALVSSMPAAAQPAFGAGGPGPRAANQNLPKTPTAVHLPTLSAEITGPGPMFNSAPSQAKGLDLEHFSYVTREYFASGTADGNRTRRVVVRFPRDAQIQRPRARESMHVSGAAHASEFTAAYVMDSATRPSRSSRRQVAMNAKRYELTPRTANRTRSSRKSARSWPGALRAAR